MAKDFFTKIGDIALSYSQNETIRQMTQAGRSANDIQKQLSSMGIGLKRQSIQEVNRYYKEVEKKKDSYKYTPTKYGISDELHEPSRKTLDSKYKYTVKFDTTSEETGLNTNRWVTVKSDTKLTVGQIKAKAEEALNDAGAIDKYNEEIRNVSLHRAIKRVDVL